MFDRFASYAENLTSPASDGFAIAPDDANDLPQVTRALYVGLGGDLVVRMQSGSEVTLRSVPSGALLPLRVVRVKVASTASQLVGLC